MEIKQNARAMLGHRVNVNDDRIRQEEFLIIPDASIRGTARRVATVLPTRREKYIFCWRTKVDEGSDVYEAEFIS